ncbi:hypothetical protein C4577_07605 [Candidatus Parcubacteria bacterium]|nr:MAG: hypothetical protein C4577_07605 [Candidatus Parcubacteria bacterium]
MPIDRYNTRYFHIGLYSGVGMLKTVRLLKRNDDQQSGVVTSYTLVQVRRNYIYKTDEPISHDMSASYRTTFHIPRTSMDAIGVKYINALDQIEELSDEGQVLRMWQVEATNTMTGKLFENHLCVEVLLISGDPL